MRLVARIHLGVLLGVALLAADCATAPSAPSARKLTAGLAEIDITPPVGYRLAGYFEERLSTGTHDPLKAKALVLQQGSQKIALVFCDLVGLSLHVSTEVRAEASTRYGIPISNISIFATHSHTGPLFGDIMAKMLHEEAVAHFGHDSQEKIDYPDQLIGRLVKVIGAANSKLAPSDLWAGVTQQEGWPYNRRYKMKDEKVVTNPGQLNPNIVAPAGLADHDVSMLMISHGQFDLLGGLTVFPMHADTVGGTEFSADYPYYIEQTLRHELGSSYISMFGSGAAGDLNHINVKKKEQVKGQAVGQDIGMAIGHTVLNHVKKMKRLKNPSLSVLNKVPMLPLQETTPDKVTEARTNFALLGTEKLSLAEKAETVKALDLNAHGKVYPMEVQVYRFDGETALVALPAEIFTELGLSIKKRSPFKNTLVVTLNNDRPGYIPTAKAFKEGSYEIINTRLAPGTGEKLADIAVGMLKELQPARGVEEDSGAVEK